MKIDEKEICRDFREAKSKRTQLVILSQLNLLSKEEVFKILVTNGEDVKGIGGSKQKKLRRNVSNT